MEAGIAMDLHGMAAGAVTAGEIMATHMDGAMVGITAGDHMDMATVAGITVGVDIAMEMEAGMEAGEAMVLIDTTGTPNNQVVAEEAAAEAAQLFLLDKAP